MRLNWGSNSTIISDVVISRSYGCTLHMLIIVIIVLISIIKTVEPFLPVVCIIMCSITAVDIISSSSNNHMCS